MTVKINQADRHALLTALQDIQLRIQKPQNYSSELSSIASSLQSISSSLKVLAENIQAKQKAEQEEAIKQKASLEQQLLTAVQALNAQIASQDAK